MNYTFIDIGCGHQSVSSDIFGTDVHGIYVEPIKEYLDVLPEGTNIVKENCVISSTNDQVQFNAVVAKNPQYYTREEIIRITEDKELFNSYYKKYGLSGQSSINFAVEGSRKIIVSSMTLETLFNKHRVTSIDYFKIDVEGHEENVLKQLVVLMKKNKIKINEYIIFEYNNLSNKAKLDRLSDIICRSFGFDKKYVESPPWNKDIVLSKI